MQNKFLFRFTKSKMDTKTIISIALVAVAFLLAEAKPFEETKEDQFMDLNEKAEDYCPLGSIACLYL